MDSVRSHFKGGGVGSSGGRRLERRNATKNISYDSHHRRNRRSADPDLSSYDESDGSSHSRDDYSLDEYRVLGKDSVEEMSNVCKYLGLPGPACLGIARGDWDAKWHSGVPSGADSVTSITQEEPTDFTFVISSPARSTAPSSPQDPFGGRQLGRKDIASEQTTSYYDRDPMSRSIDKNEAEAADVTNFIQQHAGHDQQSHRLPVLSRRSASMPVAQNRHISPPRHSAVYSQTPKPSLLGSKIFSYPESDSSLRIQRARSQPVLPSGLSPTGYESPEALVEKPTSTPVRKSVSDFVVQNPRVEQLDSRDRGTTHDRHSDPALVATTEVPMPRLVDSSSRSSSSSDGSGEFRDSYAARSRTDKATEQNSFDRKQAVERAQAVAGFRPGSLSRPPPINVLNLPSSAFSTHDLLNGLGPPSPSVAVVGVQELGQDSDDDQDLGRESVGDDEVVDRADQEDIPKQSLLTIETVAGRPVEGNHQVQHPVDEVIQETSAVQIANAPIVVRNEGQAKEPSAGDNVVLEIKPSDMENRGERSGSVDVQEGTSSATDHIMSINLTQSPVLQDLRVVDNEARAQTLTFPWSKGDLLGAGSFGTVFEAVDSNGSFFAVKEVSLTETDKNSQQCISQLEQEIELLSRFKHDNIVQYLGTQRADGKLYIFLELVSKGSLASLCKRIQLRHSQIIAYTRQILKGLKYLHDMNVVHRDIKCANILVDVKGTCKLADFGLAKQISALDQLKSCKGSAYWMAPEVIDPKKTYGRPADIWSLGCSVLEMATGSPPFGDQEWYRVLWKVGHGEAPPIPEILSDDAKDFVAQCLEVNPHKRPTATALLQHRFVANSITPTNSGQLNPQLVLSGLQTITEERTGDFTSASGSPYRSLGNSPLSNGHSGH